MKTRIPCLSSLVLAAALFLVTGCNTVYTTSTAYLGGPTYPPSDPAKIEILRVAPTRPHVRLGEVKAEPSTEGIGVQKIEDSMRKSAAKLGADAVVIVSDTTQVTGAFVTGPWYGRSVQQIEGRVILGVAIKYTGPQP